MTLALSFMDDNGFSSVPKNLRDAFILFDVNRDGRITETELESVLGFLGVEASKEEIQRMILDADLNGNGTVEFEEFLRMMRRYASERANKNKDILTMETFKVFDHNNDSLIDFEEIKRTMHFLGEAVTDNEVHEMIREADQDKDGFINFEEFKFLLKRLKSRGNSRSRTGRNN